jgi:ParB family chromosome partitioning protein
LAGGRPIPKEQEPVLPEVKELEERLRDRLNTRVSLSPGRKGGRVVIYYYSKEELNSLIDILLGEI